MKSSEPPRLATWLLEHLAFGNKNEGLAGDLVEEFRRRRSVTWYWRQVLGAILVSFSNELHAKVGAFGFAIVWTCAAVGLWQRLRKSSQLHVLLVWGTTHNWPKSLASVVIYNATMVALLWVGLILYLAMMRSFDQRRFFSALLVSLLAVVVTSVGDIFLFGCWVCLFTSVGGRFLSSPAHPLDYTLAYMELHWSAFIVNNWLPLVGALLLSMWTARPTLAPWNHNKIVA